MKLTPRNVDALPAPESGNKVYYDLEGRGSVRGLGLRVTAAGSRAWVLNYSNRAGKQRRYTIGEYPNLSLAQARAEAGRLRGDIRSGHDPIEGKHEERRRAQEERAAQQRAITIAMLAEQWFVRHASLHKRPTSQREDRRVLDRHILPRLGAKKVTEVSRGDVEALMAALAETPIQANRIHALLTTLMRYAVEHDYRPNNPCAGVRRYPEHPRVVHVTRAQLDKLYAALEAHPNRQAANAVKLAVWSGARKGEVLGARWAEIDLDRGLWMRPATRTKQKRASVIPLNPLALKLLADMRRADPAGEFLFPSPVADGEARRDVKNLWMAIRKQTGLALRLHDLRHVYATAALEAGVSLDAIAPLLGHSSTVMTKTYAHWNADALREATEKAGRLLAAANGRPAA